MKNCLLSNMSLNPEATSTPNVVPRIGRRKGIRDVDGGYNSTQSPIAPDTDQHNYSESRPYELNTSPKSVRREIILNRSKSFDDLRTEIENHNERDVEEDNKKINDNEKYDNQDKHFNLEYIKKYIKKTCVTYTCVTVIFVFLAFLRHSTVVDHHSVEVENKPKEVVNICNSQKELFQTQDQDFCLNIEYMIRREKWLLIKL
ncbi:torsin interacting protein isoform X2 [Rhynchophorus ferrugineus]|uniref:torsin interacting protein isoform X2 n=1 Tax=Rhynchophorus ferrugineus TaxID=354439 RepID=UPI003FCD8C6F